MNQNAAHSGSSISRMLETHPQQGWMEANRLAQFAQSLTDCAATCTICADACLGEHMVQELTRCIRLNLDCADVCQATASVLLRPGQSDGTLIQALAQACQAACQLCGQECERHAGMHEHCRICAETCRHCAQVCGELMQAV